MEYSIDFNKFQFIDKNRPLNAKHIEDLKQSIGKNGYLESQPITVTKDFRIVDGQHRFIACKEMGIPICYTVVNVHNPESVLIDINTTQRKWTVLDYVYYWARAGKEHYQCLLSLCKRYNLSVSSVCCIIESCSQGGRDTDIIKAGNFKFEEPEAVLETKIKTVLDCIKLTKIKPTDRIIRAMVLCSRHPEFTWKSFYKKLEYQRDKIYKCSTVFGYIRLFEDLYNNHRIKRVKFDEETLRCQ